MQIRPIPMGEFRGKVIPFLDSVLHWAADTLTYMHAGLWLEIMASSSAAVIHPRYHPHPLHHRPLLGVADR